MYVADKQGSLGMREVGPLRMVALMLGALVASSAPALGASPAGNAPTLDRLLQQFGESAPQPEAEVRLDAWVEAGPDGPEVVVRIEPEGRTKLIADPGITITPGEREGLRWRIAVPHRHVDPTIDYFPGPTALRMPFTAGDQKPIELLVEYAYCVVDYQCFFGEETLSVATRLP
jgi:hypothetical protein